MVKTAAVLINVNDMPFSDLSIAVNRRYYSHIGMELRVLDRHTEETARTSPVWLKMLLPEIFPDVDFFIAQDLDILPCSLKYDIMDFVNIDHFNMATDKTMIGKVPGKGDPFPFFKWNTGVLCYPKKYADFCRMVFNYGSRDPYRWMTFDQYYINKSIGENDIYVNEIPALFNRFFTPDIDYGRTAFVHYTNYMTTPEKRDFMLNHHPKEMLYGS